MTKTYFVIKHKTNNGWRESAFRYKTIEEAKESMEAVLKDRSLEWLLGPPNINDYKIMKVVAVYSEIE